MERKHHGRDKVITFNAPNLRFISSTKKSITKKDCSRAYYNYLFSDPQTGASVSISDWSTSPFTEALEENHFYKVSGFVNATPKGNFLVIKEIVEV